MGFSLNIKKRLLKRYLSGLFLLAFLSFGATTYGLAAYEGKSLIPMGNAVGINLQSEGVMIVGVPEILADGVSASPARDAGLSAGDIITQIGAHRVSKSEDLKSAIEKLDGTPIPVKVTRGDSVLQLRLTPHKAPDGHCELGLWMRDGIAGIGTLTFYDPETGAFGALGHAVNDMETGMIIPLREGTIMHSVVTDVVQGKAGIPGQLRGSFSVDKVLGRLTINAPSGIFGKMEPGELVRGKSPLPVAGTAEIRTGPAVILSNVSGSDVKEYKVEITRVYTGSEAVGRSMMISVTDTALLEQTGGIVQGMSGSPIIQNGKLIGAVTHVLVNDPTRGYGIAIENMLDAVSDQLQKKAA